MNKCTLSILLLALTCLPYMQAKAQLYNGIIYGDQPARMVLKSKNDKISAVITWKVENTETSLRFDVTKYPATAPNTHDIYLFREIGKQENKGTVMLLEDVSKDIKETTGTVFVGSYTDLEQNPPSTETNKAFFHRKK